MYAKEKDLYRLILLQIFVSALRELGKRPELSTIGYHAIKVKNIMIIIKPLFKEGSTILTVILLFKKTEINTLYEIHIFNNNGYTTNVVSFVAHW